MKNRLALIVGNGVSRKSLDLPSLMEHNDTIALFGCNALYRELDQKYIDFLVAIDTGIVSEIVASNFPADKFIYPPEDQQYEPAECNPYRPRSNAGMNAMLEAIKLGFTTLICVGFDFLIADKDLSISNLFDGTENYGPETRAVYQDNLGRVNYLNYVAMKNPNVAFIFAYPEKYPLQRVMVNNIKTATFDELFDE